MCGDDPETRKVRVRFFVPLILGVILGVLEFATFQLPQPRIPAVMAIALCLLVVAAGSMVARIKFGKPWLPLGWTFVVIFIVFVMLSFSDFSLPPFLASSAFLINMVLLIVFAIWVWLRARQL